MRPRPFGRGNVGDGPYGDQVYGLQCGHDLSAVETCVGGYHTVWRYLPSMRPRPFGRGNVGYGPYGDQVYGLQCGHDLAAVETAVTRHTSIDMVILQCGHDLAAVETGRPDSVLDPLNVPSIRPRPFGRGNIYSGPWWFCYWFPSMRPRPCGRGNADPGLRPVPGRAPSMRPRPFGRGNPGFLEGGDLPLREPSMRPRPFGRGNAPSGFSGWSSPGSFNAATTFRPWKQDALDLWLGYRLHPSMRPRPCGRGNPPRNALEAYYAIALQCGHDLSAVETRRAFVCQVLALP